MAQSISTCFISYCWQGMDRQDLNYFVSSLKRRHKKIVEYLYDVDVGYGERFGDFMSLLGEVDSVIIIFTPEYNRKIVNKSGGVWEEYKQIIERYHATQEERRAKDSEIRDKSYFEIIPILWKGGKEASIPDIFLDYRYLDFRNYFTVMSPTGAKRVHVGNSFKNDFNKALRKIKDALESIRILKSDSYKTDLEGTYDRLLMSKLFDDDKADFDNPRFILKGYEKTIFVKTFVYEQVEKQVTYFIVGRKGSGKSAISQVLPILCKNKTSIHIKILSKDINLISLYNIFNDTFKSDSLYLAKRKDCFSFTWKFFFRLNIMNELIVLSGKKDKLNMFQLNKMKNIKTYYETVVSNELSSESRKSQLFTYAFNATITYLNRCVELSRNEDRYFHSDFEGLFNFNNFLENAVPKNVIFDFNEIMLTIHKYILVTVDGFDTRFDDFRIDTQYFPVNSEEERANFEIDWLHSLLLLVIDLKQLGNGDNILADKVNFCISVPSDRFYEILNKDRDSYRYRRKYSILVWTGVELALFLRKRLEIFSKQNGSTLNKKKYAHPFDSLNKILDDNFNYLPKTITVEMKGRKHECPLFIYILRHTFWRPRDILAYFSKILSMSMSINRSQEEVTAEHIKAIISDATIDIIKSEFIREYRTFIKNIDFIVRLFNGSKQVINYEELELKLSQFEFDFTVKKESEVSGNIYKIKILYQLGFIGIKINNEIKEEGNYKVNELFIFSEGARLVNGFGLDNITKYNFIIHPIFREYLNLKNNTDYLVCNYKYSYLKDLEGIMNASNHGHLVDF